MIEEKNRLQDPAWKKWGPYVSDRQWGTVREDYSESGDAWNYSTHDQARSKAYRWGEEGIGGFCDEEQRLCLALAFWNGQDPILKERYFGLTNREGNHGEDVKELYYYLDGTPTHAYMKMLYKYPQAPFPYTLLRNENASRTRLQPEFELIDTGIFDQDAYFDVFVEYAKGGPEDLLLRITAYNRGKAAAPLHLLPTLWFRNTWGWGYDPYKPYVEVYSPGHLGVHHRDLGEYHLYAQGDPGWLCCDNESNFYRLYGAQNTTAYCKDGINDHLLNQLPSVNPDGKGTKAAAHYTFEVPAAGSVSVLLRLTKESLPSPFEGADGILQARISEADAYYAELQQDLDSADKRLVHRQALAGMLWNKQFYYYDVLHWLNGDPAQPSPPTARKHGRNSDWRHVKSTVIMAMPDKWEYPWFAAWDLAFHAITYTMLDFDFAKDQLRTLTREWLQHPNGQLPAYEWSFSDTNPPVHAWAAWRVYQLEARAKGGQGDLVFLETVFHKLLINFTWWVNRKDAEGNNIFEGGFLGLDNIGVFDRDIVLPMGQVVEQADGTSWMAMFCLNMLAIALELARHNKTYVELANKFFAHFLYIASALESMGDNNAGLWDEQDQFYYDQIRHSDGASQRLRVRSMVGLIPLLAVEILDDRLLSALPEFAERMKWFLDNRPELATLVSRFNEKGDNEKRLLSLLRAHRMKAVLQKMLDENEFLSPFGVRSVSKYHLEHPYEFPIDGQVMEVKYTPAESDSALFGGNSNWRGPVWMPVNSLLIESLLRFDFYYGPEFTIEYPTGSGQFMPLRDVAQGLCDRLMRIFLRDEHGQRAVFGDNQKLQNDPNFRDYVLFYEYFHGDTGKGLGAGHQTGWTGIIAKVLQPRAKHPDPGHR